MTKHNPWRTTSSVIVYRNPWISIREDRVIRPDGKPGIYGVVEIAPSCGIVALNDNNEIALVKQWRYAHNKFSIEIPTGGSKKGETPLDSAKRELLEETGLIARDWTALGSIDNSNGVTTDVAHMFRARNLANFPVKSQEDEQLELCWISFPDAVLSVIRGEITESVSVAAILKVNLLERSI